MLLVCKLLKNLALLLRLLHLSKLRRGYRAKSTEALRWLLRSHLEFFKLFEMIHDGQKQNWVKASIVGNIINNYN